ncbi:C6 transcription factor [Aspergillus udagawae]|uniref:C6 transcription factor n=1 Tax=Aspergillus udagawae TaxID=91492 RepID=A0A8H3PID5_9EURO|nr:C6 transcription factor [Aspergillus udagawae]
MSILALSARHKANAARAFYPSELAIHSGLGLQDDRYNALHFKYNAIQGLSRAVGTARPSQQDIIVASAFLLIFLDLLESGSDKWNFHLEGIKSLIAQIPPSSQDMGTTIQGLRDFIRRQIYLIDTLGATCTRPRLLSCSSIPSQSAMPLEMSVDRAFLGCPEQILGALRAFSTSRDIFIRSERSDTVDLYPYVQEVRNMLDSTQSFDCHTWVSGLPQPHSLTQPLGMLDEVAQSYKFGALIYGRRVLDALTGDTSSQHDLVCDLIRAIDALRSNDSLFKCILWPLFVAGLESQHEAQRRFVTSCLDKFWFETKCLNVVNAGIILRRFWKREDSGDISSSQWIFNIGQVEGDWLLI